MSTDVVTEQQTVALKAANVFSVALDKSIDINDNPRLAVIARYCSNGKVQEELCWLKPMHALLKEKNIFDTFTKNFQERGIHIKIFSVTIEVARAMMKP